MEHAVGLSFGWQRSVIGVLLIAGASSLIELLPIGRPPPDVALTVFAGLVLAVTIVWVAVRLQAEGRSQFVVWFALLFLNLVGVAVEGSLFAPGLAPPATLATNVTRLLVESAVIAAIVARLFGVAGGGDLGAISGPVYQWFWRLLAASALYVALYLVIGGINYTFVTRPYYESHAASLTVPSAQTVFMYEPIRGMLIALSVLPLTVALRCRVRTVAGIAGVTLFIVGGLVPLLPQAALPLYLRVASLWEIFGQNFLTGVVCAMLFARYARKLSEDRAPEIRIWSGARDLSPGPHRPEI